MFNITKHKIGSLLLVALCCMSSSSYADMLDTQLSREQIMLGDYVEVTYIARHGAGQSAPDFSALQKDFRVITSNYGSAVSMINGVTTSQTFWRLSLMPKKAGELIIPEIAFGNDKSTARKLTVLAAPAALGSAVSDKQNAAVFVRGEISATSPLVQSQFIYTLKVYFRTQIQDARMDIPQVNDAMLYPLADEPGRQTTVNGQLYTVVEKRFAVFAKKPGNITIPPLQLHAMAVDDNVSYGNDPFNYDVPKPVTLATKAVTLTVRDVPPTYQGTTWLPAKALALTEQWSDQSQHWEAGTPVTRTITITAEGLRADQLPDITIAKIPGVNVYVDQPKRNNSIQNNTIIGTLEQKVTYIPNASRSFTIPPIKVNWWDTQHNNNAVSQLNAMQVSVGASATNTPPASPQNSIEPVADITFYKSLWFWIACGLLVAWIITLFSFLRKKPEVSHTQQPIAIDFKAACLSGDAVQAQQYLLAWGREQWTEIPVSLATLRELTNDRAFKRAIEELEIALYKRNAGKWQGEDLFADFNNVKKSRSSFIYPEDKVANAILDPLPPLNPEH